MDFSFYSLFGRKSNGTFIGVTPYFRVGNHILEFGLKYVFCISESPFITFRSYYFHLELNNNNERYVNHNKQYEKKQKCQRFRELEFFQSVA